MSGSGKSTIAEQFKRDWCRLNTNEKFDILSFEFEMLAQDQIIRNLSGRLKLGISSLLSKFSPIEFDWVKKIEEESNKLADYPIYYVDNVGGVDDIYDTIIHFLNNREDKKRGLVVTIDHVLLTKGKTGQNEKEIIDSLMHSMVG